MATIKLGEFNREFDVFELENARRYRDGLLAVNKDIEAAKQETDFVKSIERQCNAVFAFFDTLFGEGAHREIFGNSTNLISCMSAFRATVDAITADAQKITS